MKPLLIIIAVLMAIVGAESLLIRSLYSDKAELKTERDKAVDNLKTCQNQKKTTEENAHDQQVENNSIRKQLSNLKRVSRGGCIVPSRPPASSNGPAAGGIVSGQDGVSVEDLLELAAEAEEVRQALIFCQSFTNGIYKANGY